MHDPFFSPVRIKNHVVMVIADMGFFYLKTLHKSMHSVFAKEYHTSKDIMKTLKEREQDLSVIKDWINQQPHLPRNIDDQLLRRFLYATNFSLEQTKNLVDLFYTMRSQIPEIFNKRDPKDENIQKVFEVIDMVPLPKLTENNYKLYIYRLVNTDPDKYQFVDSLKTFFMVADVRMVSENDFPDGEIPIFDMSGYTLRHLSKVVLPILRKYLVYSQEAHPVRLKQIHVLNVPSYMDKFMTLVKPFLKREVASMLHFHVPNSTTLFDYIPKELLPNEYGGSVGSIADIKAEWIKRVMDHRDFLLDESKWKVDESKRPSDDIYGKKYGDMQGSFKSLNID